MRRGRRCDERKLLGDVEAGKTDNACDSCGTEARGVKLHAESAGSLVDGEMADAVDIAYGGKGEADRVRWRRAVAIENVYRGHRGMIARLGTTRLRTER